MFSVIIPAYNAADFIQKSIDSVIAQTTDNFEIIVVDDGSNDETRAIVARYSDSRIHYIYQENSGVSAARNAGISISKGEYICFLDADDLWKPHHLEVVSNLIDKYPMADVYLTGYEILLHNGQIINRASPGVSGDLLCDNVFKHIWEYGYFIHTNSVACRKSVFDSVGLFEIGVKNGEDDDMWYRLFSYYSAAISSEITTTYIRENSRATVSRIFVEDWIFLHRADEILGSDFLSEDKKDYLCRLLEQRKVSFVRHCILNGQKKTAWEYMMKIDKKLIRKNKYIETLIALLIPSFITLRIIKKRDSKYYCA